MQSGQKSKHKYAILHDYLLLFHTSAIEQYSPAITMELEITLSNKGGKKVLHAGHAYTEKTVNKRSIRLRCANYRKYNCNGALTVDLDCTRIIPGSMIPHTHEPNTDFTEGLKKRVDCKKIATISRGKPSQIVKDVLAKCPVEVGAAMGEANALKQVVRRIKKGSTPKNPSCIEEIPVPLPEDYAEEVIYDNERSDRLIIFATEPGIALMGDAEELFMDGTHTMKPPQFAQLYVVRAPLGETSVPVAYAFLPSKDQSIYEEMLGALLDACTAQGKTASPKRVIIDFERAMINAVQCVLDTSVHCCYYHLTQSTYRHVRVQILASYF